MTQAVTSFPEQTLFCLHVLCKRILVQRANPMEMAVEAASQATQPGRLWRRLPGAFSSLGWTSPTLSAFPHQRGALALRSSLWPSSGPSPAGPCPSCAGSSRAGCSTPGEVSLERNREAKSPPSTCWPHFFWCSPGYGWPAGLRAHIAGSCLAFHPPVPPSPSRQGYSQSVHPQHVLIVGATLNHMQDTALGLVEPHEVHIGPLLKVVQVPLSCQLHHSSCCYLHACQGCT